MPWDPSSPGDFSRLRESMEASYYDLKPFRKHYIEYLKELAGTEYSHKSALKIVPVNLLELASSTYLDKLIGLPPRVNVSTYDRSVRPAGVKLESVVNDLLKDNRDVFMALRRATDAAFGTLGVVKVGLDPRGFRDIDGYEHNPHTPFVRNILIDDWVHDMSARAPGEWEFCGHRYEIELDEARNRDDFDEEARRSLVADGDRSRNERGEERTSKIQGDRQAKSPFKTTTSLWEMYLQREQLVVTLSLEGDSRRPLKVQPWDGAPHGPYHWLAWREIAGNTMPLTPSHLWMQLHRIVNALYRKLDRQASRQKNVTAIQSRDSKDGDIIRKASDGDAVCLQNPAAAQELGLGGIDQRNFAFMLQSKDLFNWLCGNLDILGGGGPGSDTATQDKMMLTNASQRIVQMQQTLELFVKGVLSDFAYYVWKDPWQTYQTEIDVEGYSPPPIKGPFTPEMRQHDFFSHKIDIEPYSMEIKTPGQKMGQLMQIMQGIVLPAMPQLMQQGINADWRQLFKMIAEYNQIPELEDILTQGRAPLNADTAAPQPGQGGPSRQPAAPVKRTISERVSRPGKSNNANASAAMITQLMGGRLQPAEQRGAA